MTAIRTISSAFLRSLPRLFLSLLLATGGGAFWAGPALAVSRIKDIAQFEGVRDNQLVGYGLVVGLNGTGDTLRNAAFTRQSLISMLERLGVNTRDADLKTDNVAAVMVTANLPPFSRHGSRIDITVSALGDASSLQGGTLLATPLLAANGQVFAVAQGPVSVGGYSAQGQATSVTKGVPTSGRITNGAIVENEVNFDFSAQHTLHLALNTPDMTTAERVATAINKQEGPVAKTLDPGTVEISVPSARQSDMVGFLSDVEQLLVTPDELANVVINEETGVIVMGANVRISTVAIAQGNLTIKVTETPQVSQPNALSQGGQTTVVPRTNIQVDEGDGHKMAVVEEGVTLQQLVDGLNALGVGPRDMISILQALKAAGALHANVQVM
jgi:flagellar P-ring protein precursor FlgI